MEELHSIEADRGEVEIPIDPQRESACELEDVDTMKVLQYAVKTSYQCAHFLMMVMITVACIGICFYMIIDCRVQNDNIPTWVIPLLTFVVGIWAPSPSWSTKKTTTSKPLKSE